MPACTLLAPPRYFNNMAANVRKHDKLRNRREIRACAARFVEFSAAVNPSDASGVVVVDCPHGTCDTITHHKSNRNPPDLKRDTSTGLTLQALQDPSLAHLTSRPLVTCNHFDMDGLLSAFALIEPDVALRHARLLEAAAHIGDFRGIAESSGSRSLLGMAWERRSIEDAMDSEEGQLLLRALRLNTWMNCEERLFSAPYETKDTLQKYEWMLPRLSAVLECLQDAPGGVEWADLGGAEEYDRVVQEVRQLYRAPGCTIDSSERDRLRQVVKEAAAEGMGTIVVEDIGLAVVVTVSRPHYYSLFTAAHGCDAVLSVVTGNRYELEMNYTQYTNIRSRWTQPRLDLEVLAGALNEMDAVARVGNIKWGASGMLDTGPILRLDDLGNPLPKSARYGDPSERPRFGSALSAAEMADTCVGFFRTGLKVGRGGVRRFDPMVDEWTWEEVERLNDEAFAGWK